MTTVVDHPDTGFRALARNHDFTVLWIGQTISELGSRVSTFVFPLVAFAMTGSALWAAAAEAAYLLGMAGALLPAGVLADRLHRGRVMRTSSAVGVVVYASLALTAMAGALTLPHLLVAALLTGVGAGLFSPSEMSAIRTVVADEQLPTALSQNQARQHVAALVGAPVGGALYGVTRWLPFAADAVSYAVAWVLLGRIRADLSPVPATEPTTGPRRRLTADLRTGLRFTWARPFFRVLLVWSPLTNLAVNALFFVAVLRLIEGGTDPLHIGLVETAAGVFGILGALVAPRLIEAIPTGRLTVLIAWSFVPLAVPMALWNTPVVIAAALAFGLFLNPAGNAGVSSYRMAVTPPELIGRVQSAMQFVSMASMPLAPLLAGVLLDALGGRDAMLVLGGLSAAVALIPTLSRSVRSVPKPATWRVESRPVAR